MTLAAAQKSGAGLRRTNEMTRPQTRSRARGVARAERHAWGNAMNRGDVGEFRNVKADGEPVVSKGGTRTPLRDARPTEWPPYPKPPRLNGRGYIKPCRSKLETQTQRTKLTRPKRAAGFPRNVRQSARATHGGRC